MPRIDRFGNSLGLGMGKEDAGRLADVLCKLETHDPLTTAEKEFVSETIRKASIVAFPTMNQEDTDA